MITPVSGFHHDYPNMLLKKDRERNLSTKEGMIMPEYEYECLNCHKIYTQKMSIKEHEKKMIECPDCHSKKVEPLITHIHTRTSSKS